MLPGLSRTPYPAVRSGMKKLRYAAKINAPVGDVWTTMLSDSTYRKWTSAFNQGSYFQGDWAKGSEIRFLGPDDEGSLGGMIAVVEENRPGEFISLRYVGQIVNGADDTTSDEAKKFIGTHENYSFSEDAGVTTVDVVLDSEDDFAAMFDEAWPVALAKLKEITEEHR
jgi:hypothetical protein